MRFRFFGPRWGKKETEVAPVCSGALGTVDVDASAAMSTIMVEQAPVPPPKPRPEEVEERVARMLEETERLKPPNKATRSKSIRQRLGLKAPAQKPDAAPAKAAKTLLQKTREIFSLGKEKKPESKIRPSISAPLHLMTVAEEQTPTTLHPSPLADFGTTPTRPVTAGRHTSSCASGPHSSRESSDEFVPRPSDRLLYTGVSPSHLALMLEDILEDPFSPSPGDELRAPTEFEQRLRTPPSQRFDSAPQRRRNHRHQPMSTSYSLAAMPSSSSYFHEDDTDEYGGRMPRNTNAITTDPFVAEGLSFDDLDTPLQTRPLAESTPRSSVIFQRNLSSSAATGPAVALVLEGEENRLVPARRFVRQPPTSLARNGSEAVDTAAAPSLPTRHAAATLPTLPSTNATANSRRRPAAETQTLLQRREFAARRGALTCSSSSSFLAAAAGEFNATAQDSTAQDSTALLNVVPLVLPPRVSSRRPANLLATTTTVTTAGQQVRAATASSSGTTITNTMAAGPASWDVKKHPSPSREFLAEAEEKLRRIEAAHPMRRADLLDDLDELAGSFTDFAPVGGRLRLLELERLCTAPGNSRVADSASAASAAAAAASALAPRDSNAAMTRQIAAARFASRIPVPVASPETNPARSEAAAARAQARYKALSERPGVNEMDELDM